MKVIFWDIDGTLIKTAKAGLFAFEQAASEQGYIPVDFEQINPAGRTDFYIGSQIIERATGRPATLQEVTVLVKRYEELLPSHLALREGLVLPSVRDILEFLHGSNGWKSYLLTGNSRIGAELKLRKFGLDHYFDFEGSAFCDSHFTRDDVAACAIPTIESLKHQEQPSVFVIGDTPHDIRCGKDIGAFTIGVATGMYTLEQLDACSPWWATNKLPSPQKFVSKLEEVSATWVAK